MQKVLKKQKKVLESPGKSWNSNKFFGGNHGYDEILLEQAPNILKKSGIVMY